MKTFLPRLRFPTELEFEPVQLCNAKCFCCPYSWLEEKEGYRGQKMSREQIEHFLSDFGETLHRHGYGGRTVVNPFRYSDPLVCRDLDLVLSLARKFGFKVQIITNAVSFSGRNVELLESHIDCLTPLVRISVLGSNKEEIWSNMRVDLDLTMKKLQALSDSKSPLLPMLLVSLRVISGKDDERNRLEGLQTKLGRMGIRAIIKDNWLENRIEGEAIQQKQDGFITGCGLWHNKLLRRLEVMVNGDVVLCDDDAEGRKVFGNVFEESIETIWNGPLRDEHRLIYDQTYSDKKQGLICQNCSRAEWGTSSSNALEMVRDVGTITVARQWATGRVEFI